MERMEEAYGEAWHRECAYAYFFGSIPGIGAKTVAGLYRQYGGYERMYQKGEAPTLPEAKRRLLEAHRKDWDVKQEYRRLREHKIWYIPRFVKGYPDRLSETADAPAGLFVKGRLPDEQKPAVALVGARECSPYGAGAAKELGAYLAGCGIQVVSGLARGIDGIGQRAALGAGGAVFGVLGSGADVCYPKENRELYEALAQGVCAGGVISELLPGTQPRANYFPMRNRIISALADALVVVEAKEKSGTLITVEAALAQGKDVYALPGRLHDPLSRGCNRLISQGAGVLYDVEAFVRELFYTKAHFGICREESGEEAKEQEPEKEQRTKKEQKPEKEQRTQKERESGCACVGEILDALDLQYETFAVILERLKGRWDTGALVRGLATLECAGLIERNGSFYRKR